MKNTILSLIILGLLSCGSDDKKSNTQLSKNTSNLKDTSKVSDTSTVYKAVRNFYNWYIKEIYASDLEQKYEPMIVKVDESKYQLDSSKYLNNLRNIDFFSDNFIENEKKKLESCNQAMLRMNFEEEPEAYFNTNECNFLWSNQWVGGQGEDINGFKIIEVNQKNGETTFFVNTLTGENSNFMKFRVSLSQHDNRWLIDKISIMD